MRSVDWHPSNSLLASGGRDALVKLWDCRLRPEEAMLATLQGHKQGVNKVRPCLSAAVQQLLQA